MRDEWLGIVLPAFIGGVIVGLIGALIIADHYGLCK